MSIVGVGPVTPNRTVRPGAWQHMPALDGLRALAVVAVLAFHGGYLPGGFLGVDLFFALSGFLITSLLLRDAGVDGVRLRQFWGRRARRLLPAVVVLIVAIALWTVAFGSPAELESMRRDGPWALGYLANWHAIAESGGYWESFDAPSMFDHLWSLAIEEQFYLLWPLVIVVLWRWTSRPSRVLPVACAIGIAASLAVMVSLADPAEPTRVYMGTDTRVASLLAGALAATDPARRLVGRLVAEGGRVTTAVLTFVGTLVLGAWVTVDGASAPLLYRGGLALHSIACALIVATIAAAPHAAASRLVAWRPLVWIGALSYGLYLWHWPVYVVLSPQRTGLDGPVLLVVRIAVSIAFALVSYHLVEDPIRQRAAWARGRTGMVALAGAAAVAAVALVAIPTPATQIAAFDPASIAPAVMPSTTTATPVERAATPLALPAAPTTTATAPPATIVRTTPTSAPPTIPETVATTTVPPKRGPIGRTVWAGDSIAWDMAPGVEAALNAAGVTVDVSAAAVGLGMSNTSGLAPTNLIEVLRSRLEHDGADAIVMQLSVWDASLPQAEQLLMLTALIDLVRANDATLVLVRPPVVDDEATNVGVEAMVTTAQRLSAADPGTVIVLDPSHVWGSTATLDLDGDGTPERKRDLTHICPSGAARFGAWLASELASRFDGVMPAPPPDWAIGEWLTDQRYDMPAGACAPL